MVDGSAVTRERDDVRRQDESAAPRTAPAAFPLVPAPAAPPRRRWRPGWTAACLAVLGYLAVRAVGVAVLAYWAGQRSADVGEILSTRSDAGWYLGIARDGYDAGVGTSNLAFFPLYPGVVRAVAQVVGWSSLPGVIVATLAGAVAAAGLFAVGRQVHGPRTGVVLAVLWGCRRTPWSRAWATARRSSPPSRRGVCTPCCAGTGWWRPCSASVPG
jgi:hypothetical protein